MISKDRRRRCMKPGFRRRKPGIATSCPINSSISQSLHDWTCDREALCGMAEVDSLIPGLLSLWAIGPNVAFDITIRETGPSDLEEILHH